jgi:hypothetical protein
LESCGALKNAIARLYYSPPFSGRLNNKAL